MTHRCPSLRDRKRKRETPEKLLQILMNIYPEELALEIFEKLMKGNAESYCSDGERKEE